MELARGHGPGPLSSSSQPHSRSRSQPQPQPQPRKVTEPCAEPVLEQQFGSIRAVLRRPGDLSTGFPSGQMGGAILHFSISQPWSQASHMQHPSRNTCSHTREEEEEKGHFTCLFDIGPGTLPKDSKQVAQELNAGQGSWTNHAIIRPPGAPLRAVKYAKHAQELCDDRPGSMDCSWNEGCFQGSPQQL